MMESNDGILSIMEVRTKVRVFFRNSLNKNIPRKKARFLNEDSINFEVFRKLSASKTYKSRHQEVFPKICVPETQPSHDFFNQAINFFVFNFSRFCQDFY